MELLLTPLWRQEISHQLLRKDLLSNKRQAAPCYPQPPKWTKEPIICTIICVHRQTPYLSNSNIIRQIHSSGCWFLWYGWLKAQWTDVLCYVLCVRACMHMCVQRRKYLSRCLYLFLCWMFVCLCVRQLSAVDHHDDDVYMRQKRWNKKTETSSQKKHLKDAIYYTKPKAQIVAALGQFVFESRRFENRK